MSVDARRAHASLLDIDSTFLPIGLMRLISRVTLLAEGQIAAEADVGPDHWVYAGHFPDDPIFPGTLLIEAAGQLVALGAWADGRRGNPRLVRAVAEFRHPVRPETVTLRLLADLRRKRHIYMADVRISADEIEVALVHTTLAILPKIPPTDSRTPAPALT